MSKLTEIENALRSIDPAGFQRLCDALLHALGYHNINPIGLVIGSDKVKRGTPDSLVTLPNGNYLFAEYTTQQSAVVEKFIDDMDKCLDESKTGIPASRIQQFIACHTSVLPAADEHKLVEEGKRRGFLVTALGLGPISHALLRRFPGIARDFLGLTLDTGQILSLDEFTATYGKNAFATPLDTAIRFRDEELSRALGDLQASEILVIAGAAGVGKSRFALELSRLFSEQQPDVQVRVVLYRGLDLFADVRTYFSSPGSHLIIVDDANRVSGLEHMLHLLHEPRDDRRIKIIVTVRDYALQKVTDDIRRYGAAQILTLNALKDEQIRDILVSDYGIVNHRFHERIIEVAQGNPRLAVMAARVAKREDNLQCLANVSVLYDDYFGSIRRDLVGLHDTALLRASGIISLFRTVDRKNATQVSVIEGAFQMSPDRLWEAVRRLHDLELVDLYEDEVVRISDQVLATYLFHLAFFGQRILDPSNFFHSAFFPAYKSRLFDALNPAVRAFDGEAIANAMRPHLRRRWAELETGGDYGTLLELINAFGALEESATLLFLKKRIEEVPREHTDLCDLTFKPVASNELSLWTILGQLRNSELSVVRMALEHSLELVSRRPREVPQAIHLLVERFGIRHTSYLRDYEVQKAVIDILWTRQAVLEGDQRVLVLRLLLACAASFLRTQFQTHEAKDDRAITVLTFDLALTPALRELRQSIWRNVGQLLSDNLARPLALSFVREHARGGLHVAEQRLLSSDAEVALRVLGSTLDPSRYEDCVAMQSYLQLMESRRVSLDNELGKKASEYQRRFSSPLYRLASLLLDREDLQDRAEIGWESYEARKKQKLREYIDNAGLSEIKAVLGKCVTIRADLEAQQKARSDDGHTGHELWQLTRRVLTIFDLVAERDPGLFVEVVTEYLRSGDPLNLEPQGIVPRLLEAAGPERTYLILTTAAFTRRGLWLTGYFAWLPAEAVTEDRLAQLYAHYETATVGEYFRDLDFLAKYERHDGQIVQRIVRLLVEKARTERHIGGVLSDALDPAGDIGSRMKELFGSSEAGISLLKQAYFAAAASDTHFDYNAAALDNLLDLDPDFGAEMIDWRYAHAENGHVSRFDDSRDYSSLWLRVDYDRIMRGMLERIRANQKWDLFGIGDALVSVRTDEPRAVEILANQKEFFRNWIEEAADDINQMVFVFARILNFAPEDRRELLASFMAKNQRFADFEQLPLEPSTWGWTGSQVPLLQGRVDFLESLVTLCDRVELLDHRYRIEERVNELRASIEREKKADFLER